MIDQHDIRCIFVGCINASVMHQKIAVTKVYDASLIHPTRALVPTRHVEMRKLRAAERGYASQPGRVCNIFSSRTNSIMIEKQRD
jgi:hypothetical protein